MSQSQYLAALGLGRAATPEQIKEAYRRVAKRHHPDMSGADPGSAEIFREATEAYEALLAGGFETSRPTAAPSAYGPAMEARWNVRRRFKPSEYPAWFKPDPSDGGTGRALHTASWGRGQVQLQAASNMRAVRSVLRLARVLR